jgi:hypothetical protein
MVSGSTTWSRACARSPAFRFIAGCRSGTWPASTLPIGGARGLSSRAAESLLELSHYPHLA